jgi:hypothetical protein
MLTRRVAVLLAVGALLICGAVIVRDQVMPEHTIIYQASAPEGCQGRALYSVNDEQELEHDFQGRWRSEPLSFVHGETASLVVTARGCEGDVSCEIIEDGVSVTSLERPYVICSAWTARGSGP